MKRNISLICLAHGNSMVLKETFKSLSSICDEIIFGDLCLFKEDSDLIETYKNDFNLKIVKLPFNILFHQGYANVLNFLIGHAKNDLCVYMNCSEIISIDYNAFDSVQDETFNTFFFNHATDKHRWYRCNDRRELVWSGFIHEEAICAKNEQRPYHKPIFQMADLDKDSISSFKAKVFNDSKELVYFNNYLKLVDYPKVSGATNIGWINYVTEQYESMKERLQNKGKRYEAFMIGDLDMYINDVMTNKEFEKERFENTNIIHFQGNNK